MVLFDPQLSDTIRSYAHRQERLLRADRRLMICGHCSRAVTSGCMDRTHQQWLADLVADQPACGRLADAECRGRERRAGGWVPLG